MMIKFNVFLHPRFKAGNDNYNYEDCDFPETRFANFIRADKITQKNLMKMTEKIKMEIEIEKREQEQEMNEAREKQQQALRDFWRHKPPIAPTPKKTLYKKIKEKIKDFFKGE